MADYLTEGSRFAGSSARGIGDFAEKAGISNTVAIGVSGATALALGAWGLHNGAKTGKDAILPAIAIGVGSVGAVGAGADFLKVTSDSPLKKPAYAYSLLAATLLSVAAISSQNIHKSKDQKDEEEKAEYIVSIIALVVVLLSILGMIAAKFAK